MVLNRLSIIRTNRRPVPGQNIYSLYERMTPFPNGWVVPNQNIYSLYELLRVLTINKTQCMLLVGINGNEILIWRWNNSSGTLIVDRHWCVFFLTWLSTNIKWRLVLLIEIKNGSLCNYLTASKKCDRKYQEINDSKFVRKTMIYGILI